MPQPFIAELVFTGEVVMLVNEGTTEEGAEIVNEYVFVPSVVPDAALVVNATLAAPEVAFGIADSQLSGIV